MPHALPPPPFDDPPTLLSRPALHALQEVAAFVGTVHHSFVFTIQEGLDAVREVVHHLETYDVTTVRTLQTHIYRQSYLALSWGGLQREGQACLRAEPKNKIQCLHTHFRTPDRHTIETIKIRASTPMFLMSRKIKARGVKMVLSGEGADEIFGGYLYFHKAPNAKYVRPCGGGCWDGGDGFG